MAVGSGAGAEPRVPGAGLAGAGGPDAGWPLIFCVGWRWVVMFVKGQSGNPKGRPKGSVGGRMAALAALDRMMGRRRNIADLEAALQREFDRDPAAFMRTYVMPLVPKEAKLNLDAKTVVEWKTLATSPVTGRKPPVG